MYAIFIDIETTGLNPNNHKVIDIGLKLINLSLNLLEMSYQSLVKISQEDWEQADPTSLRINGYNPETIKNGKTKNEVSEDIIAFFQNKQLSRGNSVFICQNPAFDRIFFAQLIDFTLQEKMNWPYHWLDLASMYWALTAEKLYQDGSGFPEIFSVSKNEIAKKYHLPPEAHPHKAENGVNHLILCYQALFAVNFTS